MTKVVSVLNQKYDVWACADLVDIVTARQKVTEGKPLAYFVISRAIKKTKLSGEIESALEGYELPILKSFTTQRVAYPITASEGLTVLTQIKSVAASEVITIKNEVLEATPVKVSVCTNKNSVTLMQSSD